MNGRNREYPEERHIGFVYQDYMLFHLNVRENIACLKAKNSQKY